MFAPHAEVSRPRQTYFQTKKNIFSEREGTGERTNRPERKSSKVTAERAEQISVGLRDKASKKFRVPKKY